MRTITAREEKGKERKLIYIYLMSYHIGSPLPFISHVFIFSLFLQIDFVYGQCSYGWVVGRKREWVNRRFIYEIVAYPRTRDEVMWGTYLSFPLSYYTSRGLHMWLRSIWIGSSYEYARIFPLHVAIKNKDQYQFQTIQQIIKADAIIHTIPSLHSPS